MRRDYGFLTCNVSLAVVLLASGMLSSWNAAAEPKTKPGTKPVTPAVSDQETPAREDKVVKTPAEWKKQLTANQFHVTREKGTEPPFNNAYWKSKKDGLYECVCCKQTLFDSKTKFDSGTGWPSFWQPIEKDVVAYHEDRSLEEARTEVTCSRCDAHLGHVFPDGPQPTGMRYCMNSAAMKFVARKAAVKSSKTESPKGK